MTYRKTFLQQQRDAMCVVFPRVRVGTTHIHGNGALQLQRKREGVTYISPVTSFLTVALAGVMFVDNTDLLFASDCAAESAETFVERVQRGVTNWSKTTMVTGGNINLKRVLEKCESQLSTR